jgi:hypothetical protein
MNHVLPVSGHPVVIHVPVCLQGLKLLALGSSSDRVSRRLRCIGWRRSGTALCEGEPADVRLRERESARARERERAREGDRESEKERGRSREGEAVLGKEKGNSSRVYFVVLFVFVGLFFMG